MMYPYPYPYPYQAPQAAPKKMVMKVMRVMIHSSIYDDVRDRLVEATQALKMGAPQDPETFIGPMISDKEAQRVEDWITQAKAAGARVLCGGGRDGVMVQATILEEVDRGCEVWANEVFGPVMCLTSYTDFDACDRVLWERYFHCYDLGRDLVRFIFSPSLPIFIYILS